MQGEASRRDPLGDALELRAVRISFFLQTALAIILSFIPLFDVLGFERALASGLLAAPLSAAVGISMVASARLRGGDDLARVASHAIGLSLLMLVPTLVAGVIVELVHQPCDEQQGILFLLLVAGGNAIFGAALGVTLGVLFPRRLYAGIAAAVLFLLVLAIALHRLYAEPQIFIYSLPYGYWPGSLYDEELEVTGTLWVFRGLTLLVALAMISIVRTFTNKATLTIAFERPRLTAVLGSLILAFVALMTWRSGESLGFSLTRQTIEHELSRHVETKHFEIFIASSVSAEDVEQIKFDHELRYQQLVRFFEHEPVHRIKSFIYANERQKRRLMGAAGTQISRPWAEEIHINGFQTPHPVLKHELAHVFAGGIGSGPFKVPASALVFVNIGIVEGTAVAADWPANELTIHGWARAMRALKLAPDPAQILDAAGFWAISSSRAYTVAGSFVRFLIDQYGIKKFGALYASNDFEKAYQRPLPSLVKDWEAFVDALPLSENDLLMAEHRFKRPGIFQKVCAHKAANLSRQGYQHLGSGDIEGGIERLEQLIAYGPSNVQPMIDIAEALAKNGRTDEARRWLKRAISTPDVSQKAAVEATEALAGLDWREADLVHAKAEYAQILDHHVSNNSDRLQSARLEALSRPDEVQSVLRPVLLGQLSGGKAVVRLDALARAHPDDALVHYLYARQLEAAGAFDEGVIAMQAALAGTLPDVLVGEAKMTLGRLYIRARKPSDAALVFEAFAKMAKTEAARLNAEDWAERARLLALGPKSE
jgi:Flp pilus assembly protein TadD